PVTRSPDFTRIFVICPSTCGLIAAERRDFRMDKYSVVSGIFADVATFTCTGMAAGPPPGALAELLPQPDAITVHEKMRATLCAHRASKQFFAQPILLGSSIPSAYLESYDILALRH